MKRCSLLILLLLGGAALAAAGDGPFALQFDGANDYVAVRHSTALNSSQLTVSVWIRTTQSTGEVGVVNKYVANSLNGWNLFLFNGEVRAWYFADSSNFVWDGGHGLNGGFVANGQWQQVAFTVGPGGGRLYLNGQLRASLGWTGTPGGATTTQELRLASYPNSGFYNGLIDEVSVWGRELSAAEISATRSNSLAGSETDLNGYYRLTEGTGTTAANSGRLGFLFDGALTGGPVWVSGVVLKPGVRTDPANAITSSSARFSGAASPGGTNANGWFEWGVTTNFGNATPPQPLGAGGNATNFSQSLTGLAFATLFHFRAVASNSLGVAFGPNQSFRTLGVLVETLPASDFSPTSARLNGRANPNSTSTVGWFEWGTTTNYGNVTAPQALGGGTSNTNFSEVLTSVIAGIVYHFRAVASNSVGVAFGADQRFPRFAQHAYIKASNAEENDQFGLSLAMSGGTLVVGAPFEDSDATGVNGNQGNGTADSSGAAYVFVRSGNAWAQQLYLKASNTGGGDEFGASVAVSGDTIVVGAPFEASSATGVNGNQSDNGAPFSGAAYVFLRTGTNCRQQAYLKAANTAGVGEDQGITGDLFGYSVAVSGDTVVLGAPLDDSNATGVNGNPSNNAATNSGAAYVFVRNGTNWSQQAYLKASNTGPGDQFGTKVAISGDTIVIGASGEDSDATGVNGDQSNDNVFNSGAAYVFVRNGTNWTQQAYLKASSSQQTAVFSSVAVADDTVVVGAFGEFGRVGAAYVFVRNGTNWSQQGRLAASNGDPIDFFGASVALSGNTVVVGAAGEDSNATGVNGDGSNNFAPNSGAVYVFERTGTTWAQQTYLKASNTGGAPPPFLGDSFGTAVAVAGDFVAVAAPFESSSATGIDGDQSNDNAHLAGAAYVFGPRSNGPEIRVEQSGTNIVSGGSSPQFVVAGTNILSLSFAIQNIGNANLTGLTITIDGPDAPIFNVTLSPTAPVGPSNSTTFIVRFAPTSTGTKTATLHLASNDEDENPFDIVLNGLSLSFTEDRDGDGLNDATELLLAPLGFNFQVNQAFEVNLLFSNLGGAVANLNAAGFFTQSQIQTLNVNTPLLAKDPATGLFKLTIGVEKATLLTNFVALPMTTPQTTINGQGKLEFQFNSPDHAAFFRLEAW